MSRTTAVPKIPRAATDDQWVSLQQTLPAVMKRLPKTGQNETSTMTVNELTTLRTRIDDLRKINDQLIYHRLPSLQNVVNALHVISTSQHQQLKIALAKGSRGKTTGGDDDDDDYDDDIELLESTLTPEQQVQMACREAEDVAYRYNKAKERFDGITAQFDEYGEKTREATIELDHQQRILTELRDKSSRLVHNIVQKQGEMKSLEVEQRELTNDHANIQAQVDTITVELELANETLIAETTQFHSSTHNFTRNIANLENEVVKLNDLIKTLNTTLTQRNATLVHLEDEIDKLSTLEQRCTELKLTKMNSQNELNALQQKEQQLTATIQQYTQQMQTIDLDIKKVQIEQTTKTKKINEVQVEIERLDIIIHDNANLITLLKTKLQDVTDAYHASITKVTTQHQTTQHNLQDQLDVLKHEMNAKQREYDEIYNEKRYEFERQKASLQNAIQLDQSKCDNLDQCKDDLQKQLIECAAKIELLRKDVSSYQNQQQTQSNTFQQRFLDLQQVSADLEAEEQNLRQRKITQLVKRREFELQNEEFVAQDVYRRKLHNLLQDLKGNIRVLCRIRPNLPQDGVGPNGSTTSPLQHQPGSQELSIKVKEKEHQYQFETIFGQNSTQNDVFTEVQEVVQSAIDGYEVCLFSYGLTGSGKSWTMSGDLHCENGKGIIPRSVDLIFSNAMDLQQHSPAWDIKLSVSCCQIYLDKLSDLLIPPSQQSSQPTDLKLINDHVNKKITVQNLTLRPVQTTQHVYKALEDAQKTRVVAATGMNATSSRSHFVFTLYIEMFNTETNEKRNGVLNLCDLAGSERINNAKTSGESLKETQKINSSLSTLNRIFMELAENRDHISFRECKLTDLLQYCLSGDGKTLMIVNLSPAPNSAHETYGSLQLAQTVSCVQRGQRGNGGSNNDNKRQLSSLSGMAPIITMSKSGIGNNNNNNTTTRRNNNTNTVPTPMSIARSTAFSSTSLRK